MSDTKSEKSKHADTIIRNHVLFSMGAGIIPVPVVDIFAVGATQLDMIRQLCKVYDKDFSETQGKAIVSALTTSTLAKIGARSLVKLIPVVGSYIGGVTSAVMAGASTYALGEVFKMHFEMGGTILDFDVERLKKLYQEKFEKGRKVAEEYRRQQEAKRRAMQEEAATEPPPAPEPGPATDAKSSDEILSRLKELGELKDAGIITEEEFQRMKKKLVEEFER